MAMMKSYALNSTQTDGKGGANRFVAYMVPKQVPQEQPAHPSNRYASPPVTALPVLLVKFCCLHVQDSASVMAPGLCFEIY